MWACMFSVPVSEILDTPVEMKPVRLGHRVTGMPGALLLTQRTYCIRRK